MTEKPNKPIKFGTDGWRGIIAADFTFDNVRACAQGTADYLKKTGLAKQELIIGYDTRFASEDFARAAAEVVTGNGIKVCLCTKATPTPVVSYGVLAKRAGGAIIITASHNPGVWNGFKYKTSDGASAPTEVVRQLEQNIAQTITAAETKKMSLDTAAKQGLVEHCDLAPDYLEHLNQLLDIERLRSADLKVIVDPMYGAGSGYLKSILDGGTIKITEINSERNPLFPGMLQPEPIAVNLSRLSSAVREQGASVGLASDGDADRIGITD
jgi:phosphomannomutase